MERLAGSDGIRPLLELRASPHQVFKDYFIIEEHARVNHATVVVFERSAELSVWDQVQSTIDRSEVLDHAAGDVIGPEEHRLVTGDSQGQFPVGKCPLRITT